MTRYLFPLAAILIVSIPALIHAADPIFSGPQVGEKLPPLKAKGVFGDLAGEEFDFIKQAGQKPVALIFFHERTRPAFGLTNSIMKYAASKSKTGLQCGVIFLTDDPTATEKWMHVVEKYFPKGVAYGISSDGAEGPGAYGLNRNVTLTVLVGKQGKVTANFALVQPSLQADGPKILEALVEVTGGGKAPAIADLAGPRYQPKDREKTRAAANDPKLVSLLRQVINKQASEADVNQAAAAVEKYVAENAKARKQLGQITSRVVNSDKLSNYGTEAAQETLRRWAKQYGPKATEKPNQERD